jgi:hypothetical protein
MPGALRFSKAVYSRGYGITDGSAPGGDFITLRLYDETPFVELDSDSEEEQSNLIFFQQCRTDDLVLLSGSKLDIPNNDIKRVGGSKALLDLLAKPDVCFGFVVDKWNEADGYITLLVHKDHKSELRQLEDGWGFSELSCYHYEQLSTNLREYRALKQMEFLPVSPILLQPSLSLHKKELMLKTQRDTMNMTLDERKVKEINNQVSWSESEKGTRKKKMKAFMRQYASLYNESQE